MWNGDKKACIDAGLYPIARYGKRYGKFVGNVKRFWTLYSGVENPMCKVEKLWEDISRSGCGYF